MVESNELIKKDFNIERDSKTHEQQEKIFNELIRDWSFEFRNLKKRMHPDNLIYKDKTEKRNPKHFRNYQNPTDLFKSLIDGNVYTKEVLKNQINFKSDLCEIIKKDNPDFKSKDQISVIQNVENFFDLREKNIDFFRDCTLYKAKYEKELKILTFKEMLQRLLVALAQVTLSNTSKNLINEVRQIKYSLC